MNIRNEEECNYRKVEELTKKAFWNVNFPGCNEHCLIHVLRNHEDFVPELDLVAIEDDKIVGHIAYTKCKLISDDGTEKVVLTFGPLSVDPDYQRRGIGKSLQKYSFEKAKELGYDVVVILGNPENYVTSGFKNCKKYDVDFYNTYPVALLVKELVEGTLKGEKWHYEESPAFEINEKDVELFDKDFDQIEPGYRVSQELFSIYSNATVN